MGARCAAVRCVVAGLVRALGFSSNPTWTGLLSYIKRKDKLTVKKKDFHGPSENFIQSHLAWTHQIPDPFSVVRPKPLRTISCLQIWEE
jgi:hypothetical protein